MVKEKILEFIDATSNYVLNDVGKSVQLTLGFNEVVENDCEKSAIFTEKLEDIRNLLKEDLKFFMESDPAIDSEEEVILTYPGFKAITYYRIAHELYKLGYKLIARIVTEQAHTTTGIDIHPGAKIACPFFIDHGTGIVIGETAVVGERVKLYQGVTLGALSLSKGALMKGTKRHPTIGNDVTIYANASILGDVKVGDNVTIGGNVFLAEDVPADTKVSIGKPELVVTKKSK